MDSSAGRTTVACDRYGRFPKLSKRYERRLLTTVMLCHIVDGPGQANVDLAISKLLAFRWPHDGSSFQFRAEFFNAFNHPQFANPDANFSSPTFGVISRTAVNARVGQFGLKFNF